MSWPGLFPVVIHIILRDLQTLMRKKESKKQAFISILLRIDFLWCSCNTVHICWQKKWDDQKSQIKFGSDLEILAPLLLARKRMLENIQTGLVETCRLQHLLDELTSVVTNIQFTPTPEKPANLTSSHSCRCNGFLTLFGYKTKSVVLSKIFEWDTPSVWCYIIYISAALKINMDISLTSISCENYIHLSPFVHNSRTFLSTHRPEHLLPPQDAHPLLRSASIIPLVPGLVARTLHNGIT